MMSLLAERLPITVAPARAMRTEGGSGAHRSSQISKPTVSSGRSAQENTWPAPKGTASWPSRVKYSASSGAGANWRFS